MIVLSRTSPKFLEKLFEQEIPEVFDGLITIEGVARIPGEKAKVAVVLACHPLALFPAGLK